jgi:alkane 1-monooxygenase
VFGVDRGSPDEAQSRTRSAQWVWKLPLYAWVAAQTAVIIWALTVVEAGVLPLFESIGLATSVGFMSALGVIVAHELTHHRNPLDRAVAELLMAEVTYTHFCIEHVYGHHVNVATPRDPASALLGEGFYRFLVRSVSGGLASAWRIERNRLQRKSLSVWGRHNKMLRYAGELVLIYAAVAAYAGWQGALFFFAQGAVAFVLFECVNYIEHYGLQRRELGPGRYEPIRPHHSWNSSHRMTNLFLFNLGRHPDHHLDANRKYQILRHVEDVPQLPAGYATMILLSLVPPLWRRIMDPRVAEWRDRTRATAQSEVVA